MLSVVSAPSEGMRALNMGQAQLAPLPPLRLSNRMDAR